MYMFEYGGGTLGKNSKYGSDFFQSFNSVQLQQSGGNEPSNSSQSFNKTVHIEQNSNAFPNKYRFPAESRANNHLKIGR